MTGFFGDTPVPEGIFHVMKTAGPYEAMKLTTANVQDFVLWCGGKGFMTSESVWVEIPNPGYETLLVTPGDILVAYNPEKTSFIVLNEELYETWALIEEDEEPVPVPEPEDEESLKEGAADEPVPYPSDFGFNQNSISAAVEALAKKFPDNTLYYDRRSQYLWSFGVDRGGCRTAENLEKWPDPVSDEDLPRAVCARKSDGQTHYAVHWPKVSGGYKLFAERSGDSLLIVDAKGVEFTESLQERLLKTTSTPPTTVSDKETYDALPMPIQQWCSMNANAFVVQSGMSYYGFTPGAESIHVWDGSGFKTSADPFYGRDFPHARTAAGEPGTTTGMEFAGIFAAFDTPSGPRYFMHVATGKSKVGYDAELGYADWAKAISDHLAGRLMA